ncbi:Methylsterol monooxygenase 1 [Aphanomyces cochlioides]|nr:Methylsterol monooxygenase 1 [Aphanomyces cochlioides]
MDAVNATLLEHGINLAVWEATFHELNSLAFLEPYWQHMITNYSEFTIVSLFTFVLHEALYFSIWIPYLLLDFIPYFRKYKIQQSKPNTWANTWRCLKHLLFNHVFIQLPMILGSDWGLRQLGFTTALPLPHATTIAWQCLVSFILEDFYFYWVHRIMHHKSLYKYVHKQHHEFAAPFGIAAEYAHPVETAVLGLGTFLGPLLLTRHLLTLWVWLAVRLIETIDDHSGYDLPWAWSNFVPFWAGPVHHDFHHEKFDGNYASVFTIWDYVFGTDTAFREAMVERRAKGQSKWYDFFDLLKPNKKPKKAKVA